MPGTRRLAAIVFTDLVGSTELAQADERGALELIQQQEKLARPLVAEHHGRIVKSTGDGLLLEFPSALDAVECAVAFQLRLRERAGRGGRAFPPVRVGVHLGDVQRRGGDIFGDAVNVAARVESAAEPGGVCISESVFRQVKNKVRFRIEPLGVRALKGVVEPVELFRVVPPGDEHAPAAAAPSPPRLAVLPLANISPDPKDEYFADGLTEELISVLSKIRGLRVIARTSVTPYKSTSKSVVQIGSELGVTSILEGSVRKANDRLRISLQLIDVGTQEHVWSESYDRQLADIFAIQTEVAESTAKAIRVELSEPAREFIRRAPTKDLQAYELYLRAIQQPAGYAPEGFRQAIAWLEEAIARDPAFALAQAYLGYLYVQGAGDYLPHREGFRRARPFVTRALELDPNLSEAHAALAELVMQQDHEWPRAEEEFRRALALNPSNALARLSYSTLLRVLGRDSEAEVELHAAIEINPSWQAPRRLLVDLALLRGDLEGARDRLAKWLTPDPDPSWTHLSFGVAYSVLNDPEAARRELVAAGPPRSVVQRLARAMILVPLGEPEEARQLLKELTEARPEELLGSDFSAALHALLGEKEAALDILERSAREGTSGLWLRAGLPAYDSLREEPRFRAALRAAHLPEDAGGARARSQ
ncbi:MAG TPA: adenylate/guanylate cyclase domain-containing protein [Thermoplasmata archaeon]|nr:adenylate/guanylate cyclase domain-containing protein [Thermoplasmata archaeon]